MLRRWVLLSIAFRLISSITTSSWFHPDEWFQSVELGNLISRGFGFYSQEVSLHLRNGLLPLLISLPLSIAAWIAPSSIHLRVVAFQLFVGLLDLGILWGVWRLLVSLWPEPWVKRRANLVLGLYVLPWFWMWDAIRPSSEHLSAIALWLCLGCLARPHSKTSGSLPALAGFFAVAAAALRYPSGLFSAGIGISLIFRALGAPKETRRSETRELARFSTGALVGLIIFGLPDALIYGRPWESLWMYLQYNVFTGLSSHIFGAQPVGTYLEFFTWRGLRYGINAPLALAALLFAIPGVTVGLRKLEPWALGLVLYLAGHLAIAHKEQRFMSAVWAVIVWSAVYGLTAVARSPVARQFFTEDSAKKHWLAERWAHSFGQRGRKRLRTAALAVVAAFVGVNLLFTFKALWGETLTTPSTYFDISEYLQRYPATCAVLTPRMLNSVLMPWSDLHDDRSTKLSIGWETMGNRRTPFFSPEGLFGVVWVDRAPSCPTDGDVLMQLNYPEAGASARGCELLGSGVLSLAPRSSWDWMLKHDYAKGVWYRCPASTLADVRNPRVIAFTVTHFERWPALPPFGITGERFLELARAASPPPPGIDFNRN